MLIDSSSCGPINPGVPVRATLSGTYTPSTTGLYTLEFYNYRTGIHQDIQNYFDDITLTPQTTDYSSDTIQFSASTSNLARFDLDAGSSWAGWKYIVLFSASGNYPGITNNGNWIPLNMDSILMFTATHANTSMLISTAGVLDANGKAQAALRLSNPMGPSWQGKTLHSAFVLFKGPQVQPISYASMPVTIFFIP